MKKRILFIGGSPCSGKSTVAERISTEFDAFYFKVDDYLDNFINIAAEKGCPKCKNSVSMTADETWLREPSVQCDDEFLIYEEISGLIFEEIEKINAELIVAEGAAFTPTVMRNRQKCDYIAIIPTADFQINHYKQRDWVAFVLENCSDTKKAFENWMQRDILFAGRIFDECTESSIPCIVNDGKISQNEMFLAVKELFWIKTLEFCLFL